MIQWECQDPKMKIPYHTKAYVVGISPYIALKHRPEIYGRYLQNIDSCCMATHFSPRESTQVTCDVTLVQRFANSLDSLSMFTVIRGPEPGWPGAGA